MVGTGGGGAEVVGAKDGRSRGEDALRGHVFVK